jgi:hypothetical protein
MIEGKVACPECKGEGAVHGFGCPGFRPITIPCDLCKGTKEVDRKFLRWIAMGEQLRVDRRARNKTLREEAQERGMKASDLSDMERGIKEPLRRSP